MNVKNEPLVEVRQLKKYFKLNRKQTVKAVDGLNFSIYKGETFGLVGESGCGKSTVGRTMLRLYEATAGDVLFKGENIHARKQQSANKQLNRMMQMIFQDPYASLNPRMTISDIIAEGLDIHKLVHTRGKRMKMVNELLETVGLHEEHGNRYPHEFSGGQRQRIGIARALAVKPEFIVADEPISALDVSIQAQIINLLKSLQREKGLTYLFIAHDLSMVRHISNRVGVMYLGNIVEIAPSDELYTGPLHPYTEALLSAVPIPDPELERGRERIEVKGELPSPINPPSGCVFRTRCPFAIEICASEKPLLANFTKTKQVACHKYDERHYRKFTS